MSSTDRPVLAIGISGSSSAGKTTLCALLSLILDAHTRLLFLHCDAYSKEFDELPRHSSGVLNAESRDSVHFDRLIAAIEEVKQTAQLPRQGYQSFDFIENDLQLAREKLRPEFVKEMRQLVEAAQLPWELYRAVCIVDGFLLYHDAAVREKLDSGIFLRASRPTARVRRFGRYGEAAAAEGSEEFWKTESYFDHVVWPGFVLEHGFLFPNSDVEAPLNSAALARLQQTYHLEIAPEVDMDFENSMRWSVSAIIAQLSSPR